MTNFFPESKPMGRRKFMTLGLQGAVAMALTPTMVRALLAGGNQAKLEVPPELLQKVITSALKRGGDL
ncbi:MAG TPA: hypothetical protein PLP94_04915, partial [Candidatus Saccharicenans sp.]|nr:hypothetical protein [Candidatus Saccharicenans sp.]